MRNIPADPDEAMIVRSTIDLAQNLSVTDVAEGVENLKVWNLLRDLNCDHAQGFHMGRPMPVADFPLWSTRWTASFGTPAVESARLN